MRPVNFKMPKLNKILILIFCTLNKIGLESQTITVIFVSNELVNLDIMYSAMRNLLYASIFAICFLSCNSSFQGAKKTNLGEEPIDRIAFEQQVISDIRLSWSQYVKYASGMDELFPLSQSGHNLNEYSMVLTPLSAYQTLKYAGLTEEATQCANIIKNKLDLDLDQEVDFYDIVKNVLGGLISIYETNNDPWFLEKAVKLAEKLDPVFKGNLGMPYQKINLKTGKVNGENASPEGAAGFLIEYYKLSQLTAKSKYYEQAMNAISNLFAKQSKINLIGSQINIRNGIWSNPEAMIFGGSKGLERALLTMASFSSDEELRSIAIKHMNAILKYLPETTSSGLWYEVSNMNLGTQVNAVFSLGGGYFPGMLYLNDKVKDGDKLFESYLRLWFEYGIAPDQMDYKTFRIASASYLLRGEPLESCLIMSRLGSERAYRAGNNMYFSISKFCKTDSGFSALKDVRNLEKMDEMDYYLFSQTLKFALLLANNDVTMYAPQTHYISNGGYIFKK